MRSKKRKLARTIYVLFIFAFIGWIGFSLVNVQSGNEASVLATTPTPELKVEHKVKGNKLYLAFQLKHFTLKNAPAAKQNYGEGYIVLHIDDRPVANIYKAAYVYPQLSAGKHSVKVELMHHNKEPYGIFEEFEIVVDSENNTRKIGE